MNFDWIAENQVAAMALPWPDELLELRRLGFTAVLSLSDEVPKEIAESGLQHLHVPIRDFSAPTQGQLEAAVEFIELVVNSGGRVAVHCGAGLGRTGTVVAAWLVRRGRAPSEAIGEVRRRRPGSVETRGQEAAVAAFAVEMRRRTGT